MTREEPLSGGRDTRDVVRIGATVRRPRKASSDFVRHLLHHLERAGLAGVPRHLGRDEAGREVFSFIPGEVPAKFRHFADGQVAAAARLLRGFHEATRGSALAGASPVVCHHDAGPNNTVFQAGRPVAFIDFDYAAPGEPLEDLAYMGWSWCLSSRPDRGPPEIQALQLRVLVDAYGLEAAGRQALVAAILRRQAANRALWESRLTQFDGPPTPVARIQEVIDWSEREMRFTAAHAALFGGAL
ncbi:phosphotransferase [Falsiroseomonas sp.]|uniref:phosphotransferase n=1 Tax=Falsiroseomonas sp. TaxID=2870721 RepID=UPI003F709968